MQFPNAKNSRDLGHHFEKFDNPVMISLDIYLRIPMKKVCLGAQWANLLNGVSMISDLPKFRSKDEENC